MRVVPVAFLFSLLFSLAFASPAHAMTGAIYTTNGPTCTGVNVNIFDSKDAVYLDGGPQGGGSGLEDGDYYVKVTVPNGDLLGVVTGTPQVHVTGGSFAQCYKLAYITSKETHPDNPGYDDTTNIGGEYKVWVSKDPTFSSGNKTDNFKVKAAPQPQVGSISGTKWEDLNGDGTRQGGEPRVPGWTISITGPNNFSDQTTTDSSGDYSFDNLAPGTYQVCEVPQSDWTRTYPLAADCQDAVVTANQNTFPIDFGNFHNINITGQKFEDQDGNGAKDDGDSGLQGWVIELGNGTATSSTAITDSNGNYSFSNLGPGTYMVCEQLQAGWVQTTPGTPDGVVCYTTTASSGANVVDDFGNFKLPTLTVIKTVINNNGGTLLAPNFTLHVATTTTTDFAGSDTGTQFTLSPGSYAVSETPVFGYAPSNSTDCVDSALSGHDITCTITNDDIPGTIIVNKVVVNDDFGTKTAGNFSFVVNDGPSIQFNETADDDSNAFTGTNSTTTNAGAYSVVEGDHTGYAVTYSGDCTSTIGIGETKECTITNNDLHGWMTGGGSIFTKSGDTPLTLNTRITHGFVLICKDPTNINNRLEINWNDKYGKSQKFHLTSLSSVECTKDGASPAPPANTADGFNTFTGTGIGNINGKPGIIPITFIFTDHGEPGTADTARYSIGTGGSILNVATSTLTKGNQQAHRY
jgi:hypothetical protein